MLHPADMVSLIEYAKSVKSRVWLNTNGSCFTPEKLDRLLACGLDMIEFSVDAADRETYDKARPGLDWDGLNESVRYVVRRRNETKAPTRIVCSMIMQDLIKGREDATAQYWLTFGVDEVIRRKFLTWGSNTNIESGKSVNPDPYLDKLDGDPCPFPFHRLNVDSRGKIEVCGFDITGRTNFGSIREKTIKEIWRGPQFEWWRKMHLERRGGEIPLCRECPDWQYRSWTHNWEKVIRTAEGHRQTVIQGVGNVDQT
jgi:radical SAM protein with 4Fe4S-binding SPASM domain